jgi:nitrite reductase (NO-forming)
MTTPNRARGLRTGTAARDKASRRATAGGRGAADRVRRSHAQTRTTLRFALAFIAAAALAIPLGGTRWLALHLFLAGGAMLAISGVSLMLTVTWSAAPAPPGRWVVVQRALITAGAAGVALAREGGLPAAIVGVAGSVYLAGLLALAWLLVATIRRGVERRFDVAVASYLTAIAAGVAGVVLGAVMAAGTPTPAMRAAHVTTNALGLVGLVIAGTMPFFAATVGRSRMAPRARPRTLAVTLCWMGSGLAVAVVAMAVDAGAVAAVGLGGYAVGIGGVLWLLPRPTLRQLRWAGPRVLALWAGGCWWAIAVAGTAVDAAHADRLLFGDRWLLVLVLGGYAQILWGSLSYLMPMLRGGGPERLSAGFASTRSWLGLAAANAAAVSVALSLPGEATAVAVTVWVLDSAWRAGRVGTVRAGRPTEE